MFATDMPQLSLLGHACSCVGVIILASCHMCMHMQILMSSQCPGSFRRKTLMCNRMLAITVTLVLLDPARAAAYSAVADRDRLVQHGDEHIIREEVLELELEPLQRALLDVSVTHRTVFDEVCHALGVFEEVAGDICQYRIKFPSSASFKYAKQKFFEYDPCKTRTRWNTPCPTWTNPARVCEKSTCTPGTREKWIETPGGITIEYTDISICDSSEAVGALDKAADFIMRGRDVCECLATIVNMKFDRVGDIGDLGDDQIRLLAEAAPCSVDKAFRVQSNRDEVLDETLYSDAGNLSIRLPEINTTLYAEVALQGGKCFFGECSGLAEVLIDYVLESADIVLGLVLDVVLDAHLSPVLAAVDALKEMRNATEEVRRPRGHVLHSVCRCMPVHV